MNETFNNIFWPCNCDLWPMTLTLGVDLGVISIHVLTKFRNPRSNTFWVMNYCPVISVQSQTDRQTDRKWCIRAHPAWAQVGSKMLWNNVGGKKHWSPFFSGWGQFVLIGGLMDHRIYRAWPNNKKWRAASLALTIKMSCANYKLSLPIWQNSSFTWNFPKFWIENWGFTCNFPQFCQVGN